MDSAAGFVADVLNRQVIKSVVRLNYGQSPGGVPMLPAFMPNNEEPESAKANAEVLQIAVQTGIPVPLAFALEKLNIPKAEEGEEMVQAPVPAGPGGLPPGGTPNSQHSTPNSELAAEGWKVRAGLAYGRMEGRNGDRSFHIADGVMEALKAERQSQDKLTEKVLEELTGVEARWLGGVKPFFRSLVLKAQSEQVTDADFVKALDRAKREIPELFHKLDAEAVQEALEGAMGAALVNGAVRGAMARK